MLVIVTDSVNLGNTFNPVEYEKKIQSLQLIETLSVCVHSWFVLVMLM